jgi:hypothetical protein
MSTRRPLTPEQRERHNAALRAARLREHREDRGPSAECLAAVAALSPRSKHAFELLVRGAPLEDIGATLGLSTDSVELDNFVMGPLTEAPLYPGRVPVGAPPLKRSYQAIEARQPALDPSTSGFDLNDFESLGLGWAGPEHLSPWA